MNVHAPEPVVVVVTGTENDAPALSSSSTVTPLTPTSPESWIPLALVSSHTKSPSDARFHTPASTAVVDSPSSMVNVGVSPVVALASESAADDRGPTDAAGENS